MHSHLVLVAEQRRDTQRPAKVVALEARRQARLERLRPMRPHKRPAA